MIIISLKYQGRYSAIGLDPGSAQIKMLQLKHSGGEVSIHEKIIFPTPPGTFINGKPADWEKLAERLNKVKHQLNWSGQKVNLCLNNQVSYMRTVIMPPLRKNQLIKAMQREAEKHFPLNIEKAVVSFVSTGPGKTHNGQPVREYLLAAVEKKVSDDYCNLLAEAGFIPESIETSPPAMLRSLEHSIPNKHPQTSTQSEQIRLIIDIGYHSTTLIQISDHHYRFHRILDIGLDHFVQALLVAQNSEKPGPAKREIFSKGSLEEKGLLEPARKLARLIAQSLDYWFEKEGLTEADYPALEVSGGGIFIPGLPAYLQKELALNLILHNSLRTINGTLNPKTRLRNQEGSFFTFAHGLALRGWIK